MRLYALLRSSYLLFFEDTCSTAVPLIDGQPHVQYKRITRIKPRLWRRNLQSATHLYVVLLALYIQSHWSVMLSYSLCGLPRRRSPTIPSITDRWFPADVPEEFHLLRLYDRPLLTTYGIRRRPIQKITTTISNINATIEKAVYGVTLKISEVFLNFSQTVGNF